MFGYNQNRHLKEIYNDCNKHFTLKREREFFHNAIVESKEILVGEGDNPDNEKIVIEKLCMLQDRELAADLFSQISKDLFSTKSFSLVSETLRELNIPEYLETVEEE